MLRLTGRLSLPDRTGSPEMGFGIPGQASILDCRRETWPTWDPSILAVAITFNISRLHQCITRHPFITDRSTMAAADMEVVLPTAAADMEEVDTAVVDMEVAGTAAVDITIDANGEPGA